MVTAFWLSQTLAALALAIDLFSFQLRDKNKVLFCLSLSCAVLSVHFFILGRLSGAALILSSAVRFLVASVTKSQIWPWAFLSLALVIFFQTRTGPVDSLALLASVIATVASFSRSDKSMRIGIMGATTVWLIHNAIIGSPAAVALEVFSLLSNFVGYWRFYLKTRAEG